MFLSGCRLDGCDHLTIDAKFRKTAERGILFFVIITYCFIQADHTLLNNIFTIGTDQEIGSGFGTHQRFKLIQQIFLRGIIAILCHQHQFFVFCTFIDLFFCHSAISPLLISVCAGLQTMPAPLHPDDPPEYYFSAVCFR